jgi:hypothetical protein
MVDYHTFAYNGIGASHAKTNKSRQAYSAHFACNDFAIAIVADGNKGDAHFRSDRGSCFAVEAAMEALKYFLSTWVTSSGWYFDVDKRSYYETTTRNNIFTGMIPRIVHDWNSRVEEDWNNDTPEITDDNYEMMMSPLHVYGTTLIAAVVTAECFFCIQIGDGKCVVLKDNHDYFKGQVTQSQGNFYQPIPCGDDCCMDSTASLCEVDAEKRFRIYVEGGRVPRAVFLGTSGIDNSYPVHENEKHLAALYNEIHKNCMHEGFEESLKRLQEFLPVLTQKGSGDDVSIAGILIDK